MAKIVEIRTRTWLRVAAPFLVAAFAFATTHVGVRITVVAAAGACAWALYHALRARVDGNAVENHTFEWPRLFVWVAVCVVMIPTGGLIGLALVVFMILALAEFMPTM